MDTKKTPTAFSKTDLQRQGVRTLLSPIWHLCQFGADTCQSVWRARRACVLCASLVTAACGDQKTSILSSNVDNVNFGQSSSGEQLGDVDTGLADDDSSSGGTAGSGSSGATDGDSTGLNSGTGTGTGTGTASDGGDSGNTARPMAIRLQTLEEEPIDGEFELFGDVSGEELSEQSFTVITPPSYGSVIHVESSRQFTYAPAEDFFGEDNFVYSIGGDLAARVTIEVINVNDPPSIFDELQRVVEQDTTYTELLIATDPDNEPLTYGAVNLPDWLMLDASTGLLSGTPDQSNVGLFKEISFSVRDEAGEVDEITGVSIEVIDINDAPTINIDQFPESVDALEQFSVNLYPDDPDGDLVVLSVEQNDFLDLVVTGSTIEVTASEVSDVTAVNLVIEATDLLGHIGREVIPMTIYPISASGRGRTIRGRSSGEGIHLVVLGDGYREDQQLQFRTDIEALIEKMQADIGMLTHFSAWNIHMVETPSIDSGIDDDDDLDVRNTVFNSGYFCKDVARLICADQAKIFEVAIDEYPNFDQIVMLVNDQKYGGSGGSIAISSAASIEIALHEMGHSIAGLADEYVDNYIPGSSIPPFFEGRYANVSTSNDPEVVPWRHWFSQNDLTNGIESPTSVGVFEGAYYRADGFYRPTFDSLMRTYDGVLGPVNGEQWALSVYSMANPVLDISPVSRLVNVEVGELATFSVVPLFEPSIQMVEWHLDEDLVEHSGGARPAIELSLPVGRYDLTMKVSDVSGLIRKAEPHAGVFDWNWVIVVE